MDTLSIVAIVLAVLGWLVIYFLFIRRTEKRLQILEKHILEQSEQGAEPKEE